MDKLPQEIINNIAASLPALNGQASARPALATASRAWYHAIERLTFRAITITSDELDHFKTVFSSPHRRSLLKSLVLDVVLPAYSDEACAVHESADDRARNDACATSALRILLAELSAWPKDAKLELVVNVYSPMDASHRGQEKLDKDRYDVALGARKDLFTDRYSYSYIHLSDLGDVQAHCVSGLTPPQGTTRYLDPSSLVALTAKFPQLESVMWPYQDPGFFPPLRRLHLREFVDSITAYQVPAKARRLDVNIESTEYPHHERLPDLIEPGRPSFCEAICDMIGRSSLREIYYTGPIDPSFFWPDSADTETSPRWSDVTRVNIEFDIASLSGKWAFIGPPSHDKQNRETETPLPYTLSGLPAPGHGTEEESTQGIALAEALLPPDEFEGSDFEEYNFRRVPNDDLMLPLLAAFARRLARTPSLRTAYMETRYPMSEGVWHVTYAAPGVRTGYEKAEGVDISESKVFIHAGDWRPGREVVALLEGIGESLSGEKTTVKFVEWEY
ncbi:hypothetical protein N3K66_007214 [Trichothecium roseum]|uniref:Uncharacterized protein n=1 Tax=Trichothecium roseum TaxID=47278 RepID=A0ACC0UTD8_9HYPO|nr:hypothetical protein N3K66_007214 [Trichothecium roseum]